MQPKFSKDRVAKALELKLQGVGLRTIQDRTGIHYSYVCKLVRDVAEEQLPKQLQSERARTAAIELLKREKGHLESRLAKVNAALVRYTAGEAPAPSA